MPTTHSEEGLKRVIGVPGLSLGIVNGVIGAGIFALPGIVGTNLGAFSIFAYIFCSIMMAAVMLCYAEIGSRVCKSGGCYAYVQAAFGITPGYFVNWLYFFGYSTLSSAALLNIIADSLGVLFPIFLNPLIRAAFFFILLSFLVLINIRGAKNGIGFVKVVTILKLLPLLAIIIFGLSQVKVANLQLEHVPSAELFGNTTLILFFAFAGFESSLGASGEFKNPQRTIPLSILIGGSIVLIVYMLLQMVTQGILGADIATFKTAPLAAVAAKIVGPVGATILLVTAAVSCFGNMSSDVLATPRLLFAGSNDGMFPKYLGKVHPRYATPYLAIITFGALIFILSISGGFRQLAVLASAASLLGYLAVILSTIKLRMKKVEGSEKTFKAPGGLIVPIIGMVTIIWVLSNLSKREIFATLIFLAIIATIFFATHWTRRKPKSTERADKTELLTETVKIPAAEPTDISGLK